MIITAITSRREFDELQDSWNALLADSGSNGIFLTWEWMQTWWDFFQGDRQLSILVGREGDRLAGIAPLMVVRRSFRGISYTSLEFIGSGSESTPDHLDFIARDDCRRAFIEAVFKYLSSGKQAWDVVYLRDMREDPALVDALPSVTGRICRVWRAASDLCPYITLPKTWDGYLGTLSSEGRYAVRRKERTLSKSFTVQFSIVSEQSVLDGVMRRLEETHRLRMSEKKLNGESLDTAFWKFHAAIAKTLLQRGWLFLGVLSVDDTIAACQHSFKYGGKVYYYQSGIDPAYGKYGVGAVLIANMVRTAIQEGCSEYDFLRGVEEYKSHWTKTVRQSIEVLVGNKTAKGYLVVLLTILREHKSRVSRIFRRMFADGPFSKRLIMTITVEAITVSEYLRTLQEPWNSALATVVSSIRGTVAL